MKTASVYQQFPPLQFSQPWQLLHPHFVADPEENIGIDQTLLHQMDKQHQGPLIRVSRAPQCLVVTRREARMPNFSHAARTLAASGWPVVVRSSGGSCVPQGPGVLNLALIYPRPSSWRLEDGFELLCRLLGDLLRSYGLHSQTGEVPGSFCDGRYNLQVDGRKLAGTAQRWAGTAKFPTVLCHACLLVDPPLDEATAQLNHFYRLCHNDQQFVASATTSLRQCLNLAPAIHSAKLMDEVENRLRDQLTRAFALA